MADFNLEGLLGSAFGGGGGNYLDEYLTPEQRAAMQRNAMLAASAALLKAGGESTRRIGIGEAIGGAFEAGQAGYEKAQTGALTQMALKQKMDEAKKAAELRKMISGVFAPQAAAPMPGVAPAPMPEVDTGVPPLPTSAGTAMPPAQGMARPMNPNAARANQYRQAAQMLAMSGDSKKAVEYEDLAQKLDPTATLSDKAKLLSDLGLAPTIANLRLLDKPDASPSEIRILEATGTPVTLAAVMRLRASGAASTTVNMPPQEKSFEIGLGTGQSKQAIDSKIAAQGAATIIETNQTGRNILNSGAITGTGANFFVGFNNALKQAGVDFGYADAAANSQAYAAAMGANVGQLIKQFGAGTGLSDADREFAMQMAGGKITLTEQALRKILDINDKAAGKVIDTHNKTYANIKTNIPLAVEKPVGAVPPPPPPAASQIPGGAPAANLNQQRQEANAAIARGAPAAAVRQRFKQNTGQEL
jgi:hypothetical protein